MYFHVLNRKLLSGTFRAGRMDSSFLPGTLWRGLLPELCFDLPSSLAAVVSALFVQDIVQL